MSITPTLMKDAYKIYHKFAYNKDVTHVYSNFTNRFNTHSNVPNNSSVLFVGLQYFIKEILITQWNEGFFNKDKEQAIKEYSRVVNSVLGKPVDTTHIGALHDLGYLPIKIKALEEGTLVPYQVPCLTIENTVEGFGWVTNMLETVMSAELWGISTSATTAYAYRKRFEAAPSLDKGMIPFMGHDFSYRGCFGTQAAAMSGFGHLCSFYGSDTLPAGLFAEKYYGANFDKELVMASVDATEHSVMCSYSSKGELDSLKHIINNVTPSGIVSIVSDTWDFWKLVSEYLPEIKDDIMSRDGTVVIRPDSGDPVEVLCGKEFKKLSNKRKDFDEWKEFVADHMNDLYCYNLDAECPHNSETSFWQYEDGTCYEVEYTPSLNRHDRTYYYVDNDGGDVEYCTFEEVALAPSDKGLIQCLWETFGGTVTEDGLKLLDSHIGAIYGDSITLDRQDKIIRRLVDKGFVPSVALGIGSYTYQYVTRDTHGSAVKATCIQKGEGNYEAIFKEPKTDSSKRSAKGLLAVIEVEGELKLLSDLPPEIPVDGDLLLPVFVDGVLLKETTLAAIREKVNNTFK